MSKEVVPVRHSERPARRRHWLKLSGLMALALVALAAFAPSLLLRTGLRHRIFAQFIPGYGTTVDFADVHAGWHRPIEVTGLRYRDGSVAISIDSARSDRSLFDLLCRPNHYGHLTLHGAQVVLQGVAADPAVTAGRAATDPPAPTPNHIGPHKPPRGTTQLAATRTRQLTVHGSGIQIAVQDRAGRTVPIVQNLSFEFAAEPNGAATFQLLALTGKSRDRNQVSARGRLDWPIESIEQSLQDLTLELMSCDAALFDPLLEYMRLPVAVPGSRPAPMYVRGSVSGRAKVRHAPDQSLGFDLDFELSDFELAAAANEWAFQEPQATLLGSGRFVAGSVQLDSLQVASDSLALDAAGVVTDCFGQAFANLHGAARCDWQKLPSRFRPSLHEDVSMIGSSRRPWRLRGPLVAAAGVHFIEHLQIDIATAWEALKVLDFQAGPLELAVHGHNGQIAFDPLLTTFSNGQIAVEPTIQLRAPTPVLTVSPGRVLRDVTVDSNLCDWLLRYVDPLATVSGDLYGRLSFDLDELVIPLEPNGLERAVVRGRIMLDDAEFAPNRYVQEVLAIAGIQIPANLRTSQTIAIRVENGRVHHTGLAIPFGNDYITLDGWVALDHSMEISLGLPVTEKMVGGDKRLLRLLRDKRVEVPITGTLERPTVSEDALSRNIQRLIQATLREKLMSEETWRGLLRRATR